MSIESIFLVLATICISAVLIYELVFLLFFKDADRVIKVEDSKSAAVEMEEILVQPKPLGYDEVSSIKFEQCATPVIMSLSSENILPENLDSEIKLEPAKGKRVPVLVITPSES